MESSRHTGRNLRPRSSRRPGQDGGAKQAVSAGGSGVAVVEGRHGVAPEDGHGPGPASPRAEVGASGALGRPDRRAARAASPRWPEPKTVFVKK